MWIPEVLLYCTQNSAWCDVLIFDFCSTCSVITMLFEFPQTRKLLVSIKSSRAHIPREFSENRNDGTSSLWNVMLWWWCCHSFIIPLAVPDSSRCSDCSCLGNDHKHLMVSISLRVNLVFIVHHDETHSCKNHTLTILAFVRVYTCSSLPSLLSHIVHQISRLKRQLYDLAKDNFRSHYNIYGERYVSFYSSLFPQQWQQQQHKIITQLPQAILSPQVPPGELHDNNSHEPCALASVTPLSTFTTYIFTHQQHPPNLLTSSLTSPL